LLSTSLISIPKTSKNIILDNFATRKTMSEEKKGDYPGLSKE